MKRKRLIIPVAAVVVLASLFFILGGIKRSNGGLVFQVSELERRDFEIVVSSTGTVNPVGSVDVGAEVSGTVASVHADYNDFVKKGQLLARIRPDSFEASVKEAEASVAKAGASLLKARTEYERNSVLYEKGHVSELDILTLETAVTATQADLLSAEAKLSQAETNLENTEIRSPISGTVIARSVEAGQTIASSLQAPELFIIAEDLRTMQIEADVDENDIGLVEKGQRVRFIVQAYPDLVFDGTVRQVRLQPETVQNVVIYTVVIDVRNEKRLLLPGMTATIDFIILDHPDALLVPNSALSFKPPVPDKVPGGGPFSKFTNNAQGGQKPAASSMQAPQVDKTKVFVMTEEGYPAVSLFTSGESDGVYTEVLESIDLCEGKKVITGIRATDGKKQDASKRSFFPRPGGGVGGGPPPDMGGRPM
ncbi:MAG: efflux RND transporter periplasmic adaptor subunit [Spirochaetes bacterium]|nr:efflux RND transporter periplasmic adaptor subunit [Spirochaetota bacterium]